MKISTRLTVLLMALAMSACASTGAAGLHAPTGSAGAPSTLSTPNTTVVIPVVQ